jgi:hypothetical protein
MKAQGLRLLGTSVLIVLLSATTITAPITAQARLAPETFDCSVVTEIPSIECQALVALYNSTNGPGWADNIGWLTTNTPCSWYGVGCHAGHVTGLDLWDNGLSGSIPPELSNMASLQYLDLSSDQLSGSIPPELSKLASLAFLCLNDNQLRGPLPQELTNLDVLRSFCFDTDLLCAPANAQALSTATRTPSGAPSRCGACGPG